MAIQINEIVIKAVINTKHKEAQKPQEGKKLEKEEIVMECVDQVLEILKEKTER
ncbi:MAG: DUF5908 family protein [Ignavibacteria bacterium]|jgi:hypothetical protein